MTTKAPNHENKQNAAATSGHDEYQQVDLFRTYVRPGEWKEPVKMLLLARSEDVQDLYAERRAKGMKASKTFVWAGQLMEDVPKNGTLSQGEGQPVAGKKGDVVYFFEPSQLGQFLISCYVKHFPVKLECKGKHEIQSRNFGKVNAWSWKVGALRRATEPLMVNGEILVNLPALVEERMLPQHGSGFTPEVEEGGAE